MWGQPELTLDNSDERTERMYSALHFWPFNFKKWHGRKGFHEFSG